jgi:predicted PurR-regulated permease PerM
MPILDSPGGKPQPRTLHRGVALLWVIVIAIILGFCFFASSLCITFLLASFLAILVDPIPTYLERWHLPRLLSTALLVVSGVLLAAVSIYTSYGKAYVLIDSIPQYASRIRQAVEPLSRNIEKVQKSAGSLTPGSSPKRIQEVRINEPPNWPSYLVRGVGSVWGAVIIGGVVPFLMFFMLVRKAHLYSWLANAFGSTIDVPLFVTRVTQMVRGFVVGNVVVGIVMAAVTVAVLFSLKMQGALALGVASGILNLVPFVGVVLAALLPLLAATLQFQTASPFLIIFLTVISLHLISANLLIPKFIGSRVNIGPVAATMGMLFWGWLWGVVGLLLAVPLTAFVKLVAETPRPVPAWLNTGQATVTRAIPFLRKRSEVTAKR